jgi:hypothetical protein
MDSAQLIIEQSSETISQVDTLRTGRTHRKTDWYLFSQCFHYFIISFFPIKLHASLALSRIVIIFLGFFYTMSAWNHLAMLWNGRGLMV